MDEQGLKILSIFCLLLIAIIFGLAPLYCVWRYQDGNESNRFQVWFSFMNAFAGGVFMSIALLHLLPEVRELLENAFTANGKTYSYSWAELIASIGFFLIGFLDVGVEVCLDKLGEHQDYENMAFASASSSPQSYSSQNDIALYESDSPQEEEKRKVDEGGNKPSIHGHVTPPSDILPAFVLLLSLSVHSIFEGLSLGLQSTTAGVLDLFIAIAIHKGIEAMGVAISVAKSKMRTLNKIICMVVFSLMSPVGIIIGMQITSSDSNSRDMVSGVLQGLATGTFLYITFLEILPHELKSKKYRLAKLAAVLIGFSTIAGVLAI
ncbi:zinc transporter ZIP1-like [Antedon mediterranea]|uniref:zinc transporter ZIP1-like n=1 Tax=Antedon mediterranea TaxID=105859 RepID=UPI003AF86971